MVYWGFTVSEGRMSDTADSQRQLHIFASLALSGILLAGTPARVEAAAGGCGQPSSAGTGPTATDALFILNAAIGLASCELCTCDTDNSGTITATDALRALGAAVGIDPGLACPVCVSLCEGLLAIDASGETFDTIDIGNVPASTTALWAILTPTSGDAGVAPVLRNPDGNERLMVPLHPGGGVAGGSVDVAITDGTEVCPIGSLQILPLASAPADTSANVLAAFLALIDAVASDFGMTGVELATIPIDELPSALIAPALIQIVLAGPDNVNSFAAFLAGTAPVAEDELDLDLLNRLLAEIGLESALQELLASRQPIVPAASIVRGERNVAAVEGQCGSLMPPVELEISSAEELSRLMQEGQAARDGQTSLGNGVIMDSIGMIFDTIGVAFRPSRMAGAMLFYGWALHQDWIGNLYPTHLTKVEFDIENNGRIPEDRMDDGNGGQAPYPQWTNPRLHATNLGIEVTRNALEDLLDLLSFLPISSIDDDPSLAATLQAVNDALTFLGNAGCASVPATTWGPIGGAYDPKYVEPLYFGDSVTEIIDFGSFEPIALGTTQLRLRTTDAFSGPVISEEKNIEVVRKHVSLERAEINVEPGDPVEVIATVLDSYRPEKIEWQYPAFVVNPVVEQIADDTHKLSFTSPADRTRYPFEVKLFSTSIALDPQTPPREATAKIETGAGVTITPRDRCVPNGSKLDLVATVSGLADTEDDSVSWMLLGEGDVVPGDENTAEYFAPAQGSGEAVIAATLDIDDEVSDEVAVLYGSCDVNLDLGWYAGSSTHDPDLPADIDQMKSAYYSQPLFPEEGDLLVPPDSWWNGRSRSVSTQNGSSYLHPVYDDEAAMHELVLTSASQIDAELTSLGGGAAELSMTWSTNAECQAIPNSVNGVACSNGTAEFDWNPVIWIEVSEPGTYNAQFTLSCTGGEPGGKHFVGADTHLSRHVGRAATPSFPNGGTGDPLYINPFNPFDAPPPSSDEIVLFFDPDFVCEPGSPILVQKTFQLKGPTNPPEPDVIALVILVKALMISPFDPYTQTTGPVGPHSQNGTIHASVMIARTGP